MSMFDDSSREMDELDTNLGMPDKDGEVSPERIGSPAAIRDSYQKAKYDDEEGSYNRSIIQGAVDFVPPYDDAELRDKGQGDRFNFNSGEAAAIKNEAVSGYVDIYTNPRTLVDLPLNSTIPEPNRSRWGQVMAEEFTVMDRSHDGSFPTFLQLCDLFCTHGVAFTHFKDRQTMHYSVGGLDHFKVGHNASTVTSELELVTAKSEMSVTDLYSKLTEDGALDGWDRQTIIDAIRSEASKQKDRWNNWEQIQTEIKSNEIYLSSICDPVQLIYGWVKEWDGSISFYITTYQSAQDASDAPATPIEETFLFKKRNYYKNIDEALQIFAFSTGNGGRLHSVRGLGYPIYQVCNAMDILYCKAMDNARVESSMIIQAPTYEDLEDLQVIDFGGGLALPPGIVLPARPTAANMNNSIMPVMNLAKQTLDRATGGMASGNVMMNQGDRQTKLEVSAKLDFISKTNSFAINLFYPPLDKVMREKVRRAFTVRQQDKLSRDMVDEMKERCMKRGVPPEAFKKIDYRMVKASRIIGTGSRSSRVLIFDQLRPLYSAMDATGRKNYEFDLASELVGSEKAVRYFGEPEQRRDPVDLSIAMLENMELLEGDYIPPIDGQNHMVHLSTHLEAIESGLEGVETGVIQLDVWALENAQLHRHITETLEVTTVPEELQPELNSYIERSQQIGEVVVNGIRMANKKAEKQQADMANAEGEQQGPSPEEMKQQEHQQKMQQDAEIHNEKLRQMRELGQQKIVLETQKSLGKIAAMDVETRTKLERLKASEMK